MAYTYKINKDKHYIYVQDANAVDVYPSSKFARDMNELVTLCTPGESIADFMTNTLMSDISEHNKFVDLRSQLCDQVELMAKLKGEGHPVIYPDYNYFNERFSEISKIITSKNLSGAEADKFRKPFVKEFKDCIETVLEVNRTTGRKYGCTTEKSAEKPKS